MKKIISLFLLFTVGINAQNLLLVKSRDDVAISNYAIDIAGTAEYASKSSPSDLDLNQIKFTILGWIKTPASVSGYHCIMSTDNSVGTRGWSIYIENDEVYMRNSEQSGEGFVTTDANLSADTWYFIVIVCTNVLQHATHYLVYVDNVLKPVGQSGVAMISNTNPLVVGVAGYGLDVPWLGQIGEMQIIREYNLSEAEIITAFTNGLSASYGGGTVVAWYKWSGGNDVEMLNDYSASGNDLTGNNVTQADDQVNVGTAYK